MARGKNATALFEVIHTAKKPPKSSPTVSVPTPKWWAKNKSRPAPVKPVEPASDNAGRQGSWLAAAAKRGVLPTATRPVEPDPIPHHQPIAPIEMERAGEPEPTPAVEEVAEPVAEVAPKPRLAERFAERFARKAAAARELAAAPAPEIKVVETPEVTAAIPEPAVAEYEATESTDPVEEPAQAPVTWSPSPRKPERDTVLAVDRPAGEIRFRLSYAGLIAFAFIFVIVLVIAFLAGSRLTQSAGDFTTDTKPAPDSGKTETGLMAALAPTASSPVVAPQPVRSDVLALTRHPSIQPAVTTDPTPTLASVNPTREVGSLYVVFQSYPEQELAQKACDYMNRSGVPCSLVQGLQDWAMRDWYSVVGLQPFAKHDPALPEYEKAVTVLGQKFSRQSINQFEPQAYTWRVDSDQP